MNGDPRLLRLAETDNVCVAMSAIEAGEHVVIDGAEVAVSHRVPFANKIAVVPIAAGQKVFKNGAPIGSATRDIPVGELVHTHNLASDYIPIVTYSDHQAVRKN
jgi:hypothetical protein